MARAPKFGSFGGVFVPSVLTILGVIMYLRLGWVVGNAGLVGTIGIILIAHIISVTTGLSVSSIATDKKVKAGGIYYMLSRSLGLPIGGAIGIALFVATALSIAMYIVGFGESFNNAIGLNDVSMNQVERINNLRITGTITLVVVTSIALVSTSFAIKTQYYILGAIALSLVSVVAGGLFIDHGLKPSTISLFSTGASASMETVFAIFFPAVTGFTAGVAMSGDLKDPKKSIPIGTMAAIGVGLVIYIGLAFFMSATINPESLREDTNILAKVAFFSAYGAPFLMAGIWGATLSSALGGILGGPRILQAMSLDQITPKLFGKGVGKSNEPRNALLFAFVIAEAGILIGELDLIAPIVSMFYLTAYGFINLTSALESWSGSDFKPSFKVPRAISLVGAIATFAVMFKLDMVAMFAAFIVIGAIFLYLTKKQINLGFSDVWQGVWSEVVRTGLFRMSQNAPDKRSWRPNIILFSGSTDRRPHLLEYGTKLVGRLGLLSNFDLVEDRTTTVPFAKRAQAMDNPESAKGIFTRQYSCNDVYLGIERIAETYGFSGLEPNTILMGWARYTKDPVRFSQLINRFQQLDYSLLIMDYDQRVGFGNYRRIDIWWEGKGRHISFALTISRFLQTSDDWQDAAIRLYILADTSRVDDMVIYKTLDQIQEDVRVNLEVKIINSALEQRSFYETIQAESAAADLVYLELPELTEGSEAEFFQRTDGLCKEIGTVLLYRASKEFETIDLGLTKTKEYQVSESSSSDYELLPSIEIPHLNLPQHSLLAENLQTLDNATVDLIQEYYAKFWVPYARTKIHLIREIQMLASDYYRQLTAYNNLEKKELVKRINQSERELLENLLHLVKEFQSDPPSVEEQAVVTSVDYLMEQTDDLIAKCPLQLLTEYHRNSLPDANYRNFHWTQKVKSSLTKSPLEYKFNFQRLTELLLTRYMRRALLELHNQFAQHSDQFNGDLRKYIRRISAGLQRLKTGNTGSCTEKLTDEAAQIDTRLEDLKSKVSLQINAYRDFLLNDTRSTLQQLISEIDRININKVVKTQLRSRKEGLRLQTQLKEAVSAWSYNQSLMYNLNILEILLLLVESDIRNCVEHLSSLLVKVPKKKILQQIDQLIASLQGLAQQYQNAKYPKVNVSHEIADFTELTDGVDDFMLACKQTTGLLPEKMQVPSLQNSSMDAFEEVETLEISPGAVVTYFIQTTLTAPLKANTGQLHMVLSRVDHTISDVLQVVNLSINSLDRDIDPAELSTSLISTVNGEIARLQDGKKEVELMLGQQISELEEHFKTVSQNLNVHAVIKSALDFDYYLMTQKQTQVIDKFTTYSQNVKNHILGGLTKLYYRRSEGLIAAKRFKTDSTDFGSWASRISRMMHDIEPNNQVLESLPFYYKQLFLRPHSVGKELWLIRSHEIQQAEETVAHYRRIKSGGLLVLGEPRSGKTYFSELVGKKYFDADKCIEIYPPEGGSIDLNVFQRTLKKGLKYYGDLESAFDQLKAGSVLIFNDVEQWWERSENGFEVLEALMELIDEHSQKSLFIVNMNLKSFQLINEILKIEERFFKTVKIHPFNAEELKEVILSRHKTSRLKFELDNNHEDILSDWKYAKLFTKYFDLSQGNVGIALQQWASNIRSVSDEGLIQIGYPKQPDQEAINGIDRDRAVILIQLILHRRLSTEQLQRILKTRETELEKQLEVLHRLNFIGEKNKVWEINRYLQPFLIAAFEEDMLI